MNLNDFFDWLSKKGSLELFTVIVITVIVLIILWIIFYFEKKRRQELKENAGRIGFSFSPKPEENIIEPLKNFNLFNIGHSRRAYNILKGYFNDISWTVFDYRYTVGSGKSSHTYSQTIASVGLNGVNFPKFSMAPEYFFHRIGDIFGHKDIDFSSNPVFSKKYLLKGPDEQRIRQLFSPQVLGFFEEKKDIINIEAEGDKIIIYNSGKRLKPENLLKFMDASSGIMRLLAQFATS